MMRIVARMLPDAEIGIQSNLNQDFQDYSEPIKELL